MHDIALYRRHWSHHKFPFAWAPVMVGAIMLFVGAFGFIPPIIPGLVYTFVLGMLMQGINLALYYTSIWRKLESDQMRVVNLHNSLPKDLKKQIPLSKDAILSMSPYDADTLDGQIRKLDRDHNALVSERNKYSGPAFDFKKRLAEIAKDTENELVVTRQVNDEFQHDVFS